MCKENMCSEGRVGIVKERDGATDSLFTVHFPLPTNCTSMAPTRCTMFIGSRC